jgi:hypothetical protein
MPLKPFTIHVQANLREYVIQMGWAAFRQNKIQVKTEKERQIVLKYLSEKKWSNSKQFTFRGEN